MMKNRFILTALFSFFLLGALSASYSNILEFRVVDTSGYPVESATISGTFQNVISASCSDGAFEAVTNSQGIAKTSIKNKVNGSYFCPSVRYSMKYLGQNFDLGSFDANISETGVKNITVRFGTPMRPFNVTVYDYVGKAIPNSSVYLQKPIVSSRITNSNGTAMFILPAGSDKLVFAEYENVSAYGSTNSDSIEIHVQNFYSNLTVNITDSLNTPLPNATVVIQTDISGPKQYVSNSAGIVKIPFVRGKTALLSVSYEGAQQNKSLSISSQNSYQEFIFKSALSVELVSKVSTTPGCYNLSVYAKDEKGRAIKSVNGRIVYPGSVSNFAMVKSGPVWTGIACPKENGRLMALVSYDGKTSATELDYFYDFSKDVAPVKPASSAPAQQIITNSRSIEFFPKFNLSEVDPKLLYFFGIAVYALVVVVLMLFRNDILYYTKSLIRFIRKEKSFDKNQQGKKPPRKNKLNEKSIKVNLAVEKPITAKQAVEKPIVETLPGKAPVPANELTGTPAGTDLSGKAPVVTSQSSGIPAEASQPDGTSTEANMLAEASMATNQPASASINPPDSAARRIGAKSHASKSAKKPRCRKKAPEAENEELTLLESSILTDNIFSAKPAPKKRKK